MDGEDELIPCPMNMGLEQRVTRKRTQAEHDALVEGMGENLDRFLFEQLVGIRPPPKNEDK